MAKTSVWKRFINLFRTKAITQIEKHETPEVLAKQRIEEIDSQLDDVRKGVTKFLSNLRSSEVRQNERLAELSKLEVKINSATAAYEKEKKKGASEDKLDPYRQLIENYVGEHDDLTAQADAAHEDIQKMQEHGTILKAEYQTAVRTAEKEKREINQLQHRAQTAQTFKQVAQIRADSSELAATQRSSINPLRDKVLAAEGDAVAIRELDNDSHASQIRVAEAAIERHARSSTVDNLLAGGSLKQTKAREISA